MPRNKHIILNLIKRFEICYHTCCYSSTKCSQTPKRGSHHTTASAPDLMNMFFPPTPQSTTFFVGGGACSVAVTRSHKKRCDLFGIKSRILVSCVCVCVVWWHSNPKGNYDACRVKVGWRKAFQVGRHLFQVESRGMSISSFNLVESNARMRDPI